MGFRHETATNKHRTRLIITLFARGSRVTDLIDVKLRHCKWSLGSAKAKHFKGGRNKLRIVVTRSHQSTKGKVRFRIVDAAGQKRAVKAHV
ncbi:MAG TPA: hypothetical protein VHC43_15925 [Mycobacteriales bacterium]|nr:hypothetical protein [Mycobacteriales bacterium]